MSTVANKFDLLDTVAQDDRVSPGGFRLLYLLVSRFMNRDTGEAWPSLETLAGALGIDERQVRRLIRELSEAGYLLAKRGGAGRPNCYSLIPSDWTKMSNQDEARPDKNVQSDIEQTGQKCPISTSDRTKMSAVTGQKCPPNPFIEPLEEFIPQTLNVAHTHFPEPSSLNGEGPNDQFNTFWSVYPRKVDKGIARKAFSKALKKADAATIIASAVRYAEERKGQDVTFTKYPATWLNAEGWGNYSAQTVNGAQVIDDPRSWSRSKWETAVSLAKERRNWPPAYGSPANIPADLVDAELRKIVMRAA